MISDKDFLLKWIQVGVMMGAIDFGKVNGVFGVLSTHYVALGEGNKFYIDSWKP